MFFALTRVFKNVYETFTFIYRRGLGFGAEYS